MVNDMTTASALFPLGTVLFPGGYLPLQIFEVRYLDMVRRAVADGSGFGVVALFQGAEVQRPETIESFAPIGTLVEIITATTPMPGLMQIQCVGTTRFWIQTKQRLPHGLWMAEISPLAKDSVVPVPDELANTVDALRATLGAALQNRQDQQIPEAQMPVQPPLRFEDCGWVANRWAEMLPLPTEDKQRLLALENPLLRLELIQDFLHMAGIL